jgi:hypothetical protein
MRIQFDDPARADAFLSHLRTLPGWIAFADGPGELEIIVPDAIDQASERKRAVAQLRIWDRTQRNTVARDSPEC